MLSLSRTCYTVVFGATVRIPTVVGKATEHIGAAPDRWFPLNYQLMVLAKSSDKCFIPIKTKIPNIFPLDIQYIHPVKLELNNGRLKIITLGMPYFK